MNDDSTRSFAVLGGQCAPFSANGKGVRALYQCPVCQRIWLQDGKMAVLELSAPDITRLAREVAAPDLTHLPVMACSSCLYKQGGGRVSIDEYARGEGFGLCWEMIRPVVLHATCALQSAACASQSSMQADVLTQPQKLQAVLCAAKEAPAPQKISLLPETICRLQAADQRPGFGQTGTERWRWQGWYFAVPCQPLKGAAFVTLMLAVPGDEALAPDKAFLTWKFLLDLAPSTL